MKSNVLEAGFWGWGQSVEAEVMSQSSAAISYDCEDEESTGMRQSVSKAIIDWTDLFIILGKKYTA